MPRSARPLAAQLLAAASAAALLLTVPAACSSSSDAQPPTADKTTTSVRDRVATTTQTVNSESEVRARYSEITQRYYERLQEPDPTDSSIDEDYAGASRDGVVARAGQLKSDGHLDRPGPSGFPKPSVSSVQVAGDEATVRSCLVDDVEVVDARSGATVNDDIFTQTLSTTLQRIDGTWKISEQELLQEVSGRTECDQ